MRGSQFALIALAAIGVIAAGGLAGLRPRQDILTLVEEIDPEAIRILTRFRATELLLVDVALPGAGVEELEAETRAFVQRLRRSGDFERVWFELDRSGGRRLFERLFNRRFALFAPPATVGDWKAALAQTERVLLSPFGAALEAQLREDPANLREAIVDRLEDLRPRLHVDLSRGTMLSQDRRHALVLAEPRGRALDVVSARAMLMRTRGLAPRGAVVSVLGPHVFAVSAARTVRGDIEKTLLASAVLLVAFFLVVFRRAGPVLAVCLPVLFGALVAAGGLALCGVSLHGISFAFGGVLLGIGIDYGVHLVVHYQARRARAGQIRARAMAEVVRAVWPSIGMGALTTLLAFGAVSLSGTRALGELILFCGTGLVFALLFTRFGLRYFAGLMGEARFARDGPTRALTGSLPRPAVGVAFGAMTVISIFFALELRFDGDVRHLDPQPADMRAVERAFRDRYLPLVHPTLVVVSGHSVSEVLQHGARIRGVLDEARGDGLIAGFSSPSQILPSPAQQRLWRRAWSRAEVRARAEAAMREQGFTAGYFKPFFEALERVRETELLTADGLADTPVAPLVDRHMVSDGERTELLTIVYTQGGVGSGTGTTVIPADLADALTALGATVVSAEHLGRKMLEVIRRDVARLSLLSVALVLIALWVYYREPVFVLSAIGPAVFGLAVAAGAMGAFRVPLDIVSVGAFALVAGVGVDYGIFVTDALRSSDPEANLRATRRSVLIAATTTLLGFGSLLIAETRLLFHLGFGVTAGVLASVSFALLFIPSLAPVVHRTRVTRSMVGLAVLSFPFLGLVVAAAYLASPRNTHQVNVGVAVALDVLVVLVLLRKGRGDT